MNKEPGLSDRYDRSLERHDRRVGNPNPPVPESEGGPARPGDSFNKRPHVVVMAVFYSFWALLSLALVSLAAFKIITQDSGYVVMLGVFGLIGLLTGYQARQYLSDLSKKPVLAEGEVLRKWHKGNLLIFLFPSFYVFVDDKIFSIRREDYALVLETDLLRIWHYPSSLTVDYLERYDSSEKKFVPSAHGVSL